jgi:hypothetical protein
LLPFIVTQFLTTPSPFAVHERLELIWYAIVLGVPFSYFGGIIPAAITGSVIGALPRLTGFRLLSTTTVVGMLASASWLLVLGSTPEELGTISVAGAGAGLGCASLILYVREPSATGD